MAKKKGGVSKFRAAVAGNVQQQKTQGSKYGYLNLPRNVRIFKEEPGSRVSLDILPYTVTDPKHIDKNTDAGIAVVGEQWYKKPYRVHRGIGANKETFVCLTTIGKRCPICEYRTKRQKDGDADEEELKALKSSFRNLYVVVPLNSKEHEKKPHIWDISQFLFQEKLNEELSENEDNAVFPDPEEGLTLKIRFSEEQFGKNKYASTSRIDFEEREKPYTEKDLKQVPNLDEVLQILSYKELEAKFFEYETEEEDETEKEDKEYGTSVRKRLKKDEEEEADEDDEDEDASTDDEDDDDEDEEGDDEETEDDTDEEESEEEEDDEEDEEEDEDDDSDDDSDDLDIIPEEERCVACKGTGTNSKGKPCKPCDGTGRKKQPVKETPAKAPAKEKSAPAKKEKPAGKAGKNKCPHGYVFGKECEDHDECDECAKWDACFEAKEEA